MKKVISLLLVLVLVLSVGGCTKDEVVNDTTTSAVDKTADTTDDEQTVAEVERETPILEVWHVNQGYLEAKPDGLQSQFFIEHTGVGIESPYVPWEGGEAYLQKLNTYIASGEIPDLFLPWQGNEIQLAQQGAIADLGPYLDDYAPNMMAAIPSYIWDIVRAADPAGEGRIFYVPSVELFNDYGTFVRTDWLNTVGLDMPTTQDEFVTMLRAFRDQDANGNGDSSDELPTTGREGGRWMDYLFGMYGVAMSEGYPNWDLYEGELTYSGVTQNMKDAIVFIRGLYEEGLLDPETFLNSGSDWKAKITGDLVGVWYHLGQYGNSRFEAITAINPDASFGALPNISAPGYEGFTTHLDMKRPEWVVANKDEQTIIDALTLLDWTFDPDNFETNLFRVEGQDYEIGADGNKIQLARDPEISEVSVCNSLPITADQFFFNSENQMASVEEARKPFFEAQLAIMNDFQTGDHRIAGDGMPNSVYLDNPDIQSHALFQEYMTKIIIGEYDIAKFDEFVDLWYNSYGGNEVTQKARDWYASVVQ